MKFVKLLSELNNIPIGQIKSHFLDPNNKSQYLVNPFSMNNRKFRINFNYVKFPFILELTQDYLVFVYEILKKLQKRNANTSRQRRKEGNAMAKSRDSRRLQAPQHPGTKTLNSSQPLINKFFQSSKIISNSVEGNKYKNSPPPELSQC